MSACQIAQREHTFINDYVILVSQSRASFSTNRVLLECWSRDLGRNMGILFIVYLISGTFKLLNNNG